MYLVFPVIVIVIVTVLVLLQCLSCSFAQKYLEGYSSFGLARMTVVVRCLGLVNGSYIL